MRSSNFIFLILLLVSLTLVLGFSVLSISEDVDEYTNKDTQNSEDTANNGVISTGNMPADTMEERAEMRKLTAMADYQPNE